MGDRWRRFLGKSGVEAQVRQDNGVTGVKSWALGLVIVASTAALLGTSPPEGPYEVYDEYTFERLGVDGGGVELTRDAPRATIFVTITANSLGPDDVVTTSSAAAKIDATVTSTGLAEGAAVPFLSFKISSPDTPEVTERQVLDHLMLSQPLPFTGNCSKPTEGAACRTRFQIDVERTDDGEGDGVVRLDWLFDLSSQVQVLAGTDDKTTGKMFGPLDPPWTVDVNQL